MVEKIENCSSTSIEYVPYKNLRSDFYRAIYKRLNRRGEDHLMEKVSKISDIEILDTLLEALLEGKSSNTILSILA